MRGLALVIGLAIGLGASSAATGPASASTTSAFETAGNERWIVLASRQNVDEAIGLGRRYGTQFGPPTVLSTTNGWYAVVVGPLDVPDPAAFKKKLSDAWWAPKDAFLSKGQTFIDKVWEKPSSPILASVSTSENRPRSASSAGIEVVAENSGGRGIVRVRLGDRDVASAVFEDSDSVDATSAEIAWLDRSSAFPQVIATHYTGGAHCCTQMKVAAAVGGSWQVINVGEFDGDGPQIEDINGDGSAELSGFDNSFNYAFASYAESYSPPKFLRLAGTRILDVSLSAEFQRPIRQMLLATEGLATQVDWHDNGFLAGWVAQNAMVGNGAEAWRRMLGLYNRNSDWDLSVCTIAVADSAPCPEYAKRQRDFPTALREHLAKNKYILDGTVSAAIQTIQPSFDCAKARSPTDVAICRSPRLAQQDTVVAAGYAFIKSTRGLPAADAIGAPYWRMIQQCGGVDECIANGQSEEISALAAAGAPVSLPTSAATLSTPPQPASPAQATSPPAPIVAKAAEEPVAPPPPIEKVSAGTGFFVNSDGTMVTNAHVVENCASIRVTTPTSAIAAATIIARDIRNDLALLRTGLAANKTAVFRPTIRLGESVEAFGYPLTNVLATSGNFTLGNVSALVGIGDDSRYLQISVPVQPGNSGGPLLDQSGSLVGVVSAKLNALATMVATNGAIPENVNFAIKGAIVISFLDANGVTYSSAMGSQPMQPADLADRAKAISAFIECHEN